MRFRFLAINPNMRIQDALVERKRRSFITSIQTKQKRLFEYSSMKTSYNIFAFHFFGLYLYIYLFWTSIHFGNAIQTVSESDVEMPLIGNDDVPLVAKLDTTKLNKAIKNYINKTAEEKIKKSVDDMKAEILTEVLTSKYPKDCEDIGSTENGVYRIYPRDVRGFYVYCDMKHDKRGWTVFQRRLDGGVFFFRNWNDYKNGFGNVDDEFWLGNIKIHELTSQDEYELLIQLEDFEGEKRFALYKTFYVGDPVSQYKLTVNYYSGTAGDAMVRQNGQPFATKDRDNSGNCVERFKGGWWYEKCHDSNLNGLYLNGSHTTFADGVNWKQWKGYNYSLKRSEMKIRRRR